MRWPAAWLWSRRTAPVAVAFDALIDIDPANLPPGLSPGAATAAVKAAVTGLEGAQWISVEAHRGNGPAVVARVFPAGSSVVPKTPVWAGLLARVKQEAAEALAAVPRGLAPGVPATGFAEALAPNPLGALGQLEALARSIRPAAPAWAPAPEGPAPLERLLKLVLPVDPGVAAGLALRRFGSYAAVLAAPEIERRKVAGLVRTALRRSS